LILGDEQESLQKVFEYDKFSGDGPFSKRCAKFLEEEIGAAKAIMTSSCTDALEMAALLCNLEPGDEVIMPSYTFVTTASAFSLRRVKIVWCDIEPGTKNIDVGKIEELITAKTRAIVVIHYAGVACEMEKIVEICREHRLFLIEDAAQAIGCTRQGKKLGSFGDLATLSFHETKNIQCGEGGALLVNNSAMVERAQIIRDKGTNRIYFEQGKVDKYTWVDIGSSYLMSELQAAFLNSQLEKLELVNSNRLESWNYYYRLLAEFISRDDLPVIPGDCSHNAHMFYLLLEDLKQRTDLIKYLGERGILAVFHYIPLHEAPYWKGLYNEVDLPVTQRVSDSLLRLPLYYGMEKNEIKEVVEKIKDFLH
jgi:dTDP-4-amino-4,6-dideoxygalactose transaminase